MKGKGKKGGGAEWRRGGFCLLVSDSLPRVGLDHVIYEAHDLKKKAAEGMG